MQQQTVCILGGSGFVGTHLANRLTRAGHAIRVLTRNRERNRHLLVIPTLKLMEADVHDPAQLRAHFAGCQAVVNLVGILNEAGDDGSGFRRAHVELAQKVADACREAGVPRLLQMSSLHADADKGSSYYLRSKGEAENIVRQAPGLAVTVFRPSVIFGPDDDFFNRFAGLIKSTPFVFPVTCPQARFAPVFVGDVAEAFMLALERPETIGKSYDLCGPEEWSMQQVVQYLMELLQRKRRLLLLSDETTQKLARLMQRLPGKPFTMDNYRSLQTDSVCSGENGLQSLGITPTGIESVVPQYLDTRSQRGSYRRFRSHARRQ